MRDRRRIRVLGCDIDVLAFDEAVQFIVGWLDEIRASSSRADLACRYVVTPNLDHAVLRKGNAQFRASYDVADLVVADGAPLVWSSRLAKETLPERVTGSDLTPAVLAAASRDTKVFFLGASEASSLQAVSNVKRDHPHLEVVGRLSPPFGFEESEIWTDRITAEICDSQAQLVIVGLGAPKQEIWVHQNRDRLRGTVVLCVGATIDFLSGNVRRAPEWAQRWGVEWLHRMLSDPRRLAARYGKDAIFFPRLLAEDIVHRLRNG